MKKFVKKSVSVFALLLLFSEVQLSSFSGMAEVFASEEDDFCYEKKEHKDLGRDGLKYKGFDFEKLNDKVDFLLRSDLSKLKGERIKSTLEDILTMSDEMYTQQALIDLLSMQDVTNVDVQNQLQDFMNSYNESVTKINKALAKVAKADFDEEFVSVFDANNLNYFKNMPYDEDEDNTAELSDDEKAVIELQKEEQRLVTAYQEAANRDFEADVNGKKWSVSDFSVAPPADSSEYERVLKALLKEENSVLAPYLLKLAKVRNKIAKAYGYDNYAKYADRELYGRDFDGNDRNRLYRAVKDYIVPLYNNAVEYDYKFGNSDSAFYNYEAPEAEKLIDICEPVIGDVSKHLKEAYTYMKDNHAYDICQGENRGAMSYTQSLFSYGSAFIYSVPGGDMNDVKTLIHEFGHYNAEFHSDGNSITAFSNMDISEIQSQGLETLVSFRAEDLFSNDTENHSVYTPEKLGEAYRFKTLMDMLDSVIQGCYFDEFQFKLYENPDMELDELNECAYALAQEYQLPIQYTGKKYYEWCEVGHTFTEPMYYISYAVSALGALDIAAEAVDGIKGQDVFEALSHDSSRRDLLNSDSYKKAVLTYLNISKENGEKNYKAVVEENGLHDIFSERNIRTIAINLEKIMLPQDMRIMEDTFVPFRYVLSDIATFIKRTPMLIVGMALILFSVIDMVLSRKKKH